MKKTSGGRGLAVIAGLVLSLWISGVARAADAIDAVYAKKATWQETMFAARGAVSDYEKKLSDDGFQPMRSKLLKGGQEPERMVVDVRGLKDLWLTADVGPDTYNYDQTIWAEPCLYDKSGKAYRLTDLMAESVKVGWGELIVNRDHTGEALRIGSRKFSFGFWAHAPSSLHFRLDGKYERFEAWVGVSVAAGANGSSQFEVSDRAEGPQLLDRVWDRLERDFPAHECLTQMRWEREDGIWDNAIEGGDYGRLAGRYAAASGRIPSLGEKAGAASTAAGDEAGMARVRALYYESRSVDEKLAEAKARLITMDPLALKLAAEDLRETFGEAYRCNADALKKVAGLEAELAEVRDRIDRRDPGALEAADAIYRLQREILLSNPLIDFDSILLVRRGERGPSLGLPQNWQGNCVLPPTGYDDSIVALKSPGTGNEMTVIFRPEGGRFTGDVDLNYDADRMLFSMIGSRDRWQIWEIGVDGRGLRQVTPGEEPDVDNYDACYLPDGRIIYDSTAGMAGVPCVSGSSFVANLFIMDGDGKNARRLCFDQDHDWCPTVLNNGRILYSRWEYTDTPHSNTRLLFHMNPDGTEQMEYYGSNSYWPNSTFYARPIPNHPTKVVGIASGHHGVARMGEMVIFDPAVGRNEADGAVQRIPGRGKEVVAEVRDALVDGSWPKFLHPYPLSEKYFLVSCKPTPQSEWGVYLVDVFDNMLLLKEEPGYALLEPLPLRKTPRQPAMPDKAKPGEKEATVYLTDIYAGPGLTGIPRGEVKALRVFTYVYSYRYMGGLLGCIGMDGPWDIRRVIGTVPVEEDGSALFKIPANTPVALHPLDAEGKSLQQMRSWFTAMPGEVISCTGCHERQNQTPQPRPTMASAKGPAEIQPWRGPVRGFSFKREVQPVLDRHCVACHNGKAGADGKVIADLRGTGMITDWNSEISGHCSPGIGGKFSVSYAELHRFVRRPGIESDYHMFVPMDYHADTTELAQMLRKGHYGVDLDAESWDRLVTWIDMNAPYHGTWTEIMGAPRVREISDRRRELLVKYAGHDDDEELIVETATIPKEAIMPAPLAAPKEIPACAGWPFGEAEAKGRQALAGGTTRRVKLASGVDIEMVLIPAGEFVMGSAAGHPDELPMTRVKIEAPFWLSTTEITNEQFRLYDSTHDSRHESKHGYQFGIHGYPLNNPRQPVVRISWEQAMGFCDWLSGKVGERCNLPTEAQWEYACRAGTDTPFYYGDMNADFSGFANLADKSIENFASNPYTLWEPIPNPNKYDDWIPQDDRFNDRETLSAEVGKYRPNAWGLKDMHGNVWEWTMSAMRAYPYAGDDGRNDRNAAENRVVRGGSWYDRPMRSTSSYRLSYRHYQRVFNVGFRVACPAAGQTAKREEK
ncbi:MAG TPA: SUMF1/EgtB/PvdO family nonheme iron enzyme [Candidatus Brocadiia bacterium]|nr:SUMF1/EgtB/PvdO family nonheme iron enzyme [Candidatus Brocadiia bacterium]